MFISSSNEQEGHIVIIEVNNRQAVSYRLKALRGRCLHVRLVASLLSLFGLLAIALLSDTPQLSIAHFRASATVAAPNRAWPHNIPLRIRDGANRDLMV